MEDKQGKETKTEDKMGEKEGSAFGDFEEVGDEAKEESIQELDEHGNPIITRVKMPRRGEFIGIIVQRLGGNRMEVKSTDGKTRNCRVPGRFKRSMWLRPKDFVIVKPWPDDDNKADIIFHYKNKSVVNQLRKKGILDNIKDEF